MIIFGRLARSFVTWTCPRAAVQKCAQNAKKKPTFNIKNSTVFSLARLSSLHFLFLVAPLPLSSLVHFWFVLFGFSAADSYSSIFRKRAHSRCGCYMLQLQLSELPKSMTKCATSSTPKCTAIRATRTQWNSFFYSIVHGAHITRENFKRSLIYAHRTNSSLCVLCSEHNHTWTLHWGPTITGEHYYHTRHSEILKNSSARTSL